MGELRHFRDEISKKLEYIPAKFVINQYVHPQYSCAACEKMFNGQMPPQIIPKSIAESSLVAQMVVSKYRDYQPLYQQQHIFARTDIELQSAIARRNKSASGDGGMPDHCLIDSMPG